MIPLWLKGVRGRLTAVFAAATLVVAVAGWSILSAALTAGLQASVDGVLRTRADTLASDVVKGNLEQADAPPRIVRGATTVRDVQAFSAVYSPDGALASATPNILPDAPLPSPAEVGTTTRTFGGLPFRVLVRPVGGPGGRWLVVTGVGVQSAGTEAASISGIVALAIPVVTLLAAAGAWLLAGAALRPVDRMRRDAARLGEHDPGGRVGVPATRDSLAGLATTFNALLDRLHHSLARQRSLVADAGHELRTPLAVLSVELATAVRPARTRADLVDSIEHARTEVDHLSALAEDLLLLAQADGGDLVLRPADTDVVALVADAIRAHTAAAAQQEVTLDAQQPAEVVAPVDPMALRRVLDNLITNAVRHAASPGRVQVTTRADGDVLTVQVRDDGEGFPPEFIPHAFDRFRRADSARSRSDSGPGAGLGLAIAASLVHAHRGTITATNAAGPNTGGIVTIRIPTRRDNGAGSDPRRAGTAARRLATPRLGVLRRDGRRRAGGDGRAGR